MASNPDETPTKKKKVRISLEPTRETPKRSASGKAAIVVSDDDDDEDDETKPRKKSPKSQKSPKLKKKAKAAKAKAATKEWAVLRIVGDKLVNGKLHYNIRWKGYSAKDDTWEPKSKLSCPELISAYEAAKVEVVDYEVESVMGEKIENGARYFLIKWKGYNEEDNSWEPEDQVECVDLIEKFRDLSRSTVKRPAKRPAEVAHKSPSSSKKTKLSPKKAKITPKKAKNTSKKAKTTPKTAAKKMRGRKAAKSQDPDDTDDDGTDEDVHANESDGDGELITGDDLEFEVEKIVEQRVFDDQKEYKIRWKGCSAKDDSWEHEDNISCPDILAAFLKKKKKK